MGFLKTVCICKPLSDNATPTITDVIAFGILNLRMIVWKSLCEVLKIALTTSEGFIVTEPIKTSRTSKTATSKKSPRKINITFLSELYLEFNSLDVVVFKRPYIN